ncbi:MAG TPA: tRNA epoxyqueuosine(34) reductase QueG [Steroidobacteraceae bacterium]|jgi:epoxyqueuosine reductase|nr:tRNA epoxyqueuosine(34) reductase QueG [Steroidobacteraceae bacterium]
MNPREPTPRQLAELKSTLASMARARGFDALGVADLGLDTDAAWLQRWLDAGRHGEMDYMWKHGTRRSRPAELIPGTVRVLSARMNYWPADTRDAHQTLADPQAAYISRYALGRDYHKVLRNALQDLAEDMIGALGPMGYRVFVDSGPVLERALARKAGIGWIGKHTNLLARDAGSYFFIGEILTDLPLPVDEAASAHCGSCAACIPACPTGAITAPYQLDARRCISYLTIELHGAIPVELRRLMGNRIYGCDDCQLVCPWNKFARAAAHPDFKVRHALDAARLAELFAWSEEEFLRRTEGSAIRRVGYERWLRNIAVALGNAPSMSENITALEARRDDASALVREHVAWALAEHARRGKEEVVSGRENGPRPALGNEVNQASVFPA